ncbi:hypothetical protein [Paenibacillus arenosi]|uniref:Uncharacterized protein n=1 Tax=Paenibacillus arenosi TaxID=2774142 RepID=A0ABR9AYA6_9BACL|nr:hypothetical protein [Paenibacillus arenosi]MBD8498187.1 hypothetical protein [Paenibacillus arenosi]
MTEQACNPQSANDLTAVASPCAKNATMLGTPSFAALACSVWVAIVPTGTKGV